MVPGSYGVSGNWLGNECNRSATGCIFSGREAPSVLVTSSNPSGIFLAPLLMSVACFTLPASFACRIPTRGWCAIPARHAMVHDVADFPDFPLLGSSKGWFRASELLETHSCAGIAAEGMPVSSRPCVLRHEILLVFFEIAHHFRAERQLKIAAVNCHGFLPRLQHRSEAAFCLSKM